MNPQPLVSVIVNCYNGEKYLKEALDSIYAQTYENWEIIFFDNQSNDRSAKIAKEYDGRLKYIYNEVNVPLGEARKLALTHACGEWIAFLDVDDIWVRDKLCTQLEFVAANPTADLVYAAVQDILPTGEVLRRDGPSKSGEVGFDTLLVNFDINMVTPIVKNSFLKLNNLTFDNSITASEEYNLFMRCAALGTVYRQGLVLGKYRVSEGSLTDKRINSWANERFKTLAACVQLNPELLGKYPSYFVEAINKGIYYEVRYNMKVGNYRAARRSMRKIGTPRVFYFILYILSFSRNLWSVVHKKNIKGPLTSKIRSIFYRSGI